MLVKCICTNCAGHLEFEEENAGETIPCPHCGFETVLTLPGTATVDQELLALSRRRALRRRSLQLAGTLLALVGFCYALYRWGAPWLQDQAPSIDSTAKAMVILLLGCALVPFALFWLVFPILVFLQLRKSIELLARIAAGLESRNFEPTPAEEEVSSSEETAQEQTESK